MERNDAAQDRRKADGRNLFEVFVEAAYARVSGAAFFFFCLAVIAVWLVSLPWWSDLKSWELAIHTVVSVLTLLLLALLENASRRSDEAAQEKMNVLAEALAALMDSRARSDPELDDAVRKLREAVGLEERH
jgi:low affinity Fe/Cu permease